MGKQLRGKWSGGTGRLTSYYKANSPLHFFKDKSSSTFQAIRYYIDCGDDEERLYAGNGELHSLLRDKISNTNIAYGTVLILTVIGVNP